MAEIYTVGETMAAMVPKERGLLRYQSMFQMKIAGAESNVAIAAVKLGHSAAFATRIGNDELGQFIRHRIRAEGVDVSGIKEDSEHSTGLMIKQLNAKDTSVFYYRAQAAASCLSFQDLDFDEMKKARIIHLTGITPVLSESCRKMTDDIFRCAQEQGIPVSFDPNIRCRLWKNTDYSSLIRDYTLQSEIVLMGIEEARLLFPENVLKEEKGKIEMTECTGDCLPPDMMRVLAYVFRCGKAEYIALKNGGEGAFVAQKKCRKGAPVIDVKRIGAFPCNPVDPVGAGDGFNAAFLCGILEGKDLCECGQMGAVVGAMATQTKGDYEGYPDAEQLRLLMAGQEQVYR